MLELFICCKGVVSDATLARLMQEFGFVRGKLGSWWISYLPTRKESKPGARFVWFTEVFGMKMVPDEESW